MRDRKMRTRSFASSTAVMLTATAAFLFLTSSANVVAAQPGGDAQGLFAMSAADIDGVNTSLAEHNGKVALVVNLASK